MKGKCLQLSGELVRRFQDVYMWSGQRGKGGSDDALGCCARASLVSFVVGVHLDSVPKAPGLKWKSRHMVPCVAQMELHVGGA